MASHSSILTWKIPWTEESGRLLSLGSQRVGHYWVTNTLTVMPYTMTRSKCLTHKRYHTSKTPFPASELQDLVKSSQSMIWRPIATPNTVNKWSLPTDKMPAPPAWVFFRWGFVLILGKDGAFGYNIQKLCISCIFPTRTSHTLQRHIHRSSAEVGRQMGTRALTYGPTHGRQGSPARGSSAGPSATPPTVRAAGGTPVRPHRRSLAPAGFLLPLGWRRPVRSVTQ